MADILIVGKAPTSNEGKEYFLHCLDWWWDILVVIDRLLRDKFPIDTRFVRAMTLAVPSPAMNATESIEFSKLVKDIVQDGSARACLTQIYRDDPVLLDYYGDNEGLLMSNIDDRIEQLDTFASFLESCGGCKARWYYPDD